MRLRQRNANLEEEHRTRLAALQEAREAEAAKQAREIDRLRKVLASALEGVKGGVPRQLLFYESLKSGDERGPSASWRGTDEALFGDI